VITLDALARDSGTFLMVAMDQRESLRTMLAEHGHDATDERIVQFKLAVTRELSPHASALLVDSEYGWFDRIVSERLVAPSCGLIMAVDALDQQPGEIVEDTSLDETVDVAGAAEAGVVAIKLLVIWRDDAERARRVEMSNAFAELARTHGLLSGMLAGRAVWTATLGADDPMRLLREQSVPRLEQLAAIVDEHARPWREKGAV
jgi:sulfofructosephosphate aldolase